MRWFKHMTQSADDEKLALLQAEFGLEGYGYFWRVLEIIALQVDASDRCYCEYPNKIWAKKLGITPGKFKKLCEFSKKFGIFLIDFDIFSEKNSENLKKNNGKLEKNSEKLEKNSENLEKNEENLKKNEKKSEKNSESVTRIIASNLLKYRDEWTKRKSQNSGVTPETLGSKDIDTDTDIDTEKEKEVNPLCISPLGENHTQPVKDVLVDVEPPPPEPPKASPPETKKTRRKKPVRPFPEDFAVTDEFRQMANEHGKNADREFERFKDYCQSHGRQYADYSAAFRNWLRNHQYDGDSNRASQPRYPTRKQQQLANNYAAGQEFLAKWQASIQQNPPMAERIDET